MSFVVSEQGRIWPWSYGSTDVEDVEAAGTATGNSAGKALSGGADKKVFWPVRMRWPGALGLSLPVTSTESDSVVATDASYAVQFGPDAGRSEPELSRLPPRARWYSGGTFCGAGPGGTGAEWKRLWKTLSGLSQQAEHDGKMRENRCSKRARRRQHPP